MAAAVNNGEEVFQIAMFEEKTIDTVLFKKIFPFSGKTLLNKNMLHSTCSEFADSIFKVIGRFTHVEPVAADPDCSLCGKFVKDPNYSPFNDNTSGLEVVIKEAESPLPMPRIRTLSLKEKPVLCQDCQEDVTQLSGKGGLKPLGDNDAIDFSHVRDFPIKITRLPNLLNEGETRLLTKEQLGFHGLSAMDGSSTYPLYSQARFEIQQSSETEFQVSRCWTLFSPGETRKMNIWTLLHCHRIKMTFVPWESKKCFFSSLENYKNFYFEVQEIIEIPKNEFWDPAFTDLSRKKLQERYPLQQLQVPEDFDEYSSTNLFRVKCCVYEAPPSKLLTPPDPLKRFPSSPFLAKKGRICNTKGPSSASKPLQKEHLDLKNQVFGQRAGCKGASHASS